MKKIIIKKGILCIKRKREYKGLHKKDERQNKYYTVYSMVHQVLDA